jgi:hypothetical protein
VRLRRTAKLDGTLLGVMRELFAALEAAIATYATLHGRLKGGVLDDHDRAAAIAAAKRLSAYYLLTRRAILMKYKPAEILDVWIPVRVFEAISRFAYALTALAEPGPDPEPEALLSITELDEVIDQYALRTWMDGMRSPDGPIRLDQTP